MGSSRRSVGQRRAARKQTARKKMGASRIPQDATHWLFTGLKI